MVSASPFKEPRPYCLTLFSKTRFYGDASKGLQYMRPHGGAGTSPPVIYTSNSTIRQLTSKYQDDLRLDQQDKNMEPHLPVTELNQENI